jgi:hypothetical protein
VRGSDELCKNTAYFKEYREKVLTPTGIRSIYNHLMGLDVVEFEFIEPPRPQYMQNLIELSTPHEELWLKDLVYANIKKEKIELSSKDAYASFKVFMEESGFEYTITVQKLGVYLSNLNLPEGCIAKGRHTRAGNTKYYNINRLREYFKIGELEEYISSDAMVEKSA